jgi:hypothetical protein
LVTLLMPPPACDPLRVPTLGDEAVDSGLPFFVRMKDRGAAHGQNLTASMFSTSARSCRVSNVWTALICRSVGAWNALPPTCTAVELCRSFTTARVEACMTTWDVLGRCWDVVAESFYGWPDLKFCEDCVVEGGLLSLTVRAGAASADDGHGA